MGAGDNFIYTAITAENPEDPHPFGRRERGTSRGASRKDLLRFVDFGTIFVYTKSTVGFITMWGICWAASLLSQLSTVCGRGVRS